MKQATRGRARARRRATPGLLTAEAFAALPIEGPADLVEGVVIPMSPTGRIHGRVVVRCAEILAAHVRALALPLDVVAGDVGFVLRRGPDSVRGADVAVLLQAPAGTPGEGFVDGPPTMAVEVRSPGDRPGEVDRKIGEYLAAGSAVVWDVDPRTGTVTVHRKGKRARELRGDDVLDAAPVLPRLAEPVRALFS